MDLPLTAEIEGKLPQAKKFQEQTKLENISSSGAYFCLDSGVVVGSKLNLIIELPKKLTEGKKMKMRLGGITVRLEKPDKKTKKQGVAVRFSKDFRVIPETKEEISPCSLVALTGGIACGKSVVGRDPAREGLFCPFRRPAAHELMAPGTEAWRAVVAHFGPGILEPDGTIDRAGWARSSSPTPPSGLSSTPSSIPWSSRGSSETRRASWKRKAGTRIFVSEAALIFEAGFAPVLRQDRRRLLSARTSRSGA